MSENEKLSYARVWQWAINVLDQRPLFRSRRTCRTRYHLVTAVY